MTSAIQKEEEQFLIEKIDCLIKFFISKKNLHENGYLVRYSIIGKDLGYYDCFLRDKEKFLNNHGEQIYLFVNFLNQNNFNIKQENYPMSEQTLVDLSEKEVCSFGSSSNIISIIQNLKNIRGVIAVGDEITRITFIYKGEESIDDSKINKDDIVRFCINEDYLNEYPLTSRKVVPIILLIDLCLKKIKMVDGDVKKALNSGRGRIYMKGSYKKTEIIVTEQGKNVLSDRILAEFICSAELNLRKSKI